jgi:glucokinase
MSDANGFLQPRLVADVGRNTVRIGLTDNSGHLEHASVREYDPKLQPTISSSISAFVTELGLLHLPKRAAIAVSGIPRGETISITNSRWILSRSGLAAMFGAEPLIINDFAATAWAVGSSYTAGRIESIGGYGIQPHKPGTYCIIGIGSGLGVAALSRDRHGVVNVVPTEAGHMCLMSGLPLKPALLERLEAQGTLLAEGLISAPGLQRIHSAVCDLHSAKACASLSEILNPARRSDPLVNETLEAFATTFWYFAGNIVLAYGAWDGVIITGSIAAQTKGALQRSAVRRQFAIPGLFSHRLAAVPAAMASFRHAELEGAAVALLVDDAHGAFGQPKQPAPAAKRNGIPAQDLAPSGDERMARIPLGHPRPVGIPLSSRRRRPACA